MQYSRIISFFLVFLTFGIVALGNPVVKRQDIDSVESVLTTLQGSTGSILPQITALGNSGTATDDSVTPLINELTDALNTATASISAIDPSSITKRETLDDIAVLVAGIVNDIAVALDVISVTTVPALEGLIVTVDVALQGLLVSVNVLLVGVSVLVSGLLLDVSGLLTSVGLTLVLALLGL